MRFGNKNLRVFLLFALEATLATAEKKPLCGRGPATTTTAPKIVTQCNADNCARAVTGGSGTAKASHYADCQSWRQCTVTPTRATTTETISFTAESASRATGVTTTNTATPITACPNRIAPYASLACASDARYSSACSCFGLKTNTYSTLPTTTDTTTSIVYVTPTSVPPIQHFYLRVANGTDAGQWLANVNEYLEVPSGTQRPAGTTGIFVLNPQGYLLASNGTIEANYSYFPENSASYVVTNGSGGRVLTCRVSAQQQLSCVDPDGISTLRICQGSLYLTQSDQFYANNGQYNPCFQNAAPPIAFDVISI